MRVEHLTHTYGENTPFCRSAVKDVNMEILEGEFLGIIGHTGSGKSTLIQHLNGLLKPTSGKICLGDRDIWADPNPGCALPGGAGIPVPGVPAL